MSNLDDMIVAGRSVAGAFYQQWNGTWPPGPGSPFYIDSDSYRQQDVFDNGINCSGLINWMRWQGGLNGDIGGVLAYGNELTPVGNFGNPSEDYLDSNWYPCGTLLVQKFGTGFNGEGHIAIISRPNQRILQAIHNPGVNENYTASSMHAEMVNETGTGWHVAGVFADTEAAEGLPGWGDGGVSGYPGDSASPEETAAWMARVAERIYGLPGILPVMTSCVELTQAWTGPGDVRGVPGYLTPVDFDSLGWFQQRPSAGWGTPEQITDAEYALSKFLDAALACKPESVPDLEDAQALGEWCQTIQVSAVPDAYRDKGYPLARKVLPA